MRRPLSNLNVSTTKKLKIPAACNNNYFFRGLSSPKTSSPKTVVLVTFKMALVNAFEEARVLMNPSALLGELDKGT